MRTAKSIFFVFFLLLTAAVCVFDAEGAVRALSEAIGSCLTVVVPSLFALSAVSTMLVESGALRPFLRVLWLLLGRLFKMDYEIFEIFLFSLLGGYPVGIKLLSELSVRDEGMRGRAERALAYCYCGSPSFVIAVAGIGLFSNARAGVIIYLSNMLSCVLIAFFLRFFSEKPRPFQKRPISADADGFIRAVSSSARAMLIVSAMIVFFSAISFSLRTVFSGRLPEWLYAVLEVSAVRGLSAVPLPLAAALMSFGGFCVVLQIKALSGKSFSVSPFLLARIPAAVLSAGLVTLISRLWGLDTAALAPSVHYTQAADPTASVALIAMAILLILSVEGVNEIRLSGFFNKSTKKQLKKR